MFIGETRKRRQYTERQMLTALLLTRLNWEEREFRGGLKGSNQSKPHRESNGVQRFEREDEV